MPMHTDEPDTHGYAHLHAHTAHMCVQRSQWEALLRFMLHKPSCFGTLMGKMWELVCSSTFSSLCLSLCVSISVCLSLSVCPRASSISCSFLLSYDVPGYPGTCSLFLLSYDVPDPARAPSHKCVWWTCQGPDLKVPTTRVFKAVSSIRWGWRHLFWVYLYLDTNG